MTVGSSTVVPWQNPSEVFALHIAGSSVPIILVAIMTFVLISSSGTMAMAVNFGYRRDRPRTALLMLATAALGATFVGMQALEWTRSEEHTSELQSLMRNAYSVFCLKKTKRLPTRTARRAHQQIGL